MTDAFRFPIRVKPRARQNHVGGLWGADGDLVVSVQSPAVDGKANASVIKVLAEALDVLKADIEIIGGLHNRSKVVAIRGLNANAQARLSVLQRGRDPKN